MSCRHCVLVPQSSGKLSWFGGASHENVDRFGTAHIETDGDGVFSLVCECIEPFDDTTPTTSVTSIIERCPWCGDVPRIVDTFRKGELFVYVRDGEGMHLELGQVSEVLSGNRYRCWYSTGDTTAVTDARNMRKLSNAGFSHIERDGEDNFCEWELVNSGPLYDLYRCSKCLYEHSESRTDAGATELDPAFCPKCGRIVR